MPGWVNLTGPIVADTVYSDGELVGKDVTATLPSITPLTAEYKAMGTLTLPMPGQMESMELSLTKMGVDKGLSKLAALQIVNLEFRWVQDSLQSDGTLKPEGCKAFMRAIPKTIPGASIEPGSISENEFTFEVLRYQVIIGGEELWLIDRLAQIQRINGTDYFRDISSLL